MEISRKTLISQTRKKNRKKDDDRLGFMQRATCVSLGGDEMGLSTIGYACPVEFLDRLHIAFMNIYYSREVFVAKGKL